MGLIQTIEVRDCGDIFQIHLNGKDFQVSFDKKVLTMTKAGFEMIHRAFKEPIGKECLFMGNDRMLMNPEPSDPEPSDSEKVELPVTPLDYEIPNEDDVKESGNVVAE